MATNENAQKSNKSLAKASDKPAAKATSKQKDQDVAAVVQNTGTMLQDVQNSIVEDEATRDSAIDQMEAQAIAAHMKMLEDHSIPLEKREQILEKYYERIDKKRQYESEHEKENTKRWNMALWAATFMVLGTAAIKYAPDIINAIAKSRKA